jgi:hypothetical protein
VKSRRDGEVRGAGLGHHGVATQVEFESKICKQYITLQLQAFRSRRFQHGFRRVNLHRLTTVNVELALADSSCPSLALNVTVITPMEDSSPSGRALHQFVFCLSFHDLRRLAAW